MFDWIGSLQIQEHSPRRVVLSLSRGTHKVGWAAIAVGGCLALWLADFNLRIALVPLGFSLFGIMLIAWRRQFDFDSEAGVLRYRHQLLGIGKTQVIPLFHIRAIVVALRGANQVRGQSFVAGDYVAYIEKRVGEPIYLDESRRCAELLAMAEAASEVADLRLEYHAVSQA